MTIGVFRGDINKKEKSLVTLKIIEENEEEHRFL